MAVVRASVRKPYCPHSVHFRGTYSPSAVIIWSGSHSLSHLAFKYEAFIASYEADVPSSPRDSLVVPLHSVIHTVQPLHYSNSGTLYAQTGQIRRTLYVKCRCTPVFHYVTTVWSLGAGAGVIFQQVNRISGHDVLSTSLVLKPSCGPCLRTRPYLSAKVSLVTSQPWFSGNFTSLLAEVQFKGKKIAHMMAHPFLFHSLSSPLALLSSTL